MPSAQSSPNPAPLGPGGAAGAAVAPPKRPSLVSRHSSSTHVAQSPAGPPLPRPGPARPHKHVVGRQGRNPSFHRSLSKLKIPNSAVAVIDDDSGPPTPKARHHNRTHSSGALSAALSGALSGATPTSAAPPSPGHRPGHAMKRTNTSLALPRTSSQTTLKKNHSSGQLTRLGSSRNVIHAHKGSRQERPDLRRAHTQPHKRHKSPAPAPDHRRQTSVHFNVGSDDDDDDQAQEMEGVDDQWTEDSASASPNTTRDNTRNNTRQNSIVLDPVHNPYAQSAHPRPEEKPPDSNNYNDDDDEEDEDDDDDTDTGNAPPAIAAPLHASSTRTRDFATQDEAQEASHKNAQLHHLPQQQQEAAGEGDDADAEDADQEAEELDERHQQLRQLQHERQQLLRKQYEQQEEQDKQLKQQERELKQKQRQEQQEQEREKQQQQQQQQQQQAQQEAQMSESQENGRHDKDSDVSSQKHTQRAPSRELNSPSLSSHHSRPLDTDLIAKRLLEKNSPAPPRVSSISALANAASADPKSLSQSQNGNLAPTGANNTPIVSRFVGPEDGTDSKDATPRTHSGFLRSSSRHSSISHSHVQQDTNLQRNKSAPDFAAQERGFRSPTTPSGARTPDTLMNNSRTQQKLWLQRGLSNIEASSQPHLPALLPTGRAQAMRIPQRGMQFEFVDKEYAVVRRFHNTLLQGVERIRVLNGGSLPGKPKRPLGSSAPTTTVNGKRPGTARSMRSVKCSASMAERSHRSSASQRAKVSFHTGASPESGRQSPVDDEEDDEEDDGRPNLATERPLTAADIARRIWESDVGLTAAAA
ncbi:hypothetical protein AAFC00_004271 [Neodothiora populina]|uniref:Uncharacterized protein n=1 Tax=Neodothiora populina TaxID=2781224 RepID=A0ABR3PJ44_9PEZI